MTWLIAGFYHFGGVQELTTRLPGAILTSLGVPLIYSLGRLVFPGILPALFTALVYLTMLPVVRHGRLAMLDGMTISFFLLLLLCLLKAPQNRVCALGVGFCLGLIMLTKGIIVLPLGAIACLFLLVNRQFQLFTSPYLWIGMVLGNAPAIAWYFAQWNHYGNIFLQVHFQSQSFNRILKPVEGNGGPPWYYMMEIIKYGFPWLLFLPSGLGLAWQKRQTFWGSLVIIGTVIYFGTISLMKTKLPWYVLPVYPFFALAIGANLAEIWQLNRVKSRILPIILAAIAVAGIGGCGYFIIVNPQPSLIIMSLVVSISMGSAAWLIQQGDRRFIPVLFAGMYLILGLLMSSQSWIWELNEAFPVKPVAELIRANVSPGTKIYTSFSYGRPSLDFYGDCQTIATDLPNLQKIWANKSYLLLDNTALHNLDLRGSRVIGKSGDLTLIAPPFP
jgi:4-amino-4-deoxy-L-arabinose transferase-like glycosyltransferase